MSDADYVSRLVRLGSDPSSISRIQALARRSMAEIDYVYPRKSCAATLSHFLKESGINVPLTYRAQHLADRLRFNRRWEKVDLGDQKSGDVGVCASMANDVAGYDHIYLVVGKQSEDLVIIADNQAQGRTHARSVSGRGGKTPTIFFLRASQNAGVRAFDVAASEDVPDEKTNDLIEPYMDDGTSRLLNDDGTPRIIE